MNRRRSNVPVELVSQTQESVRLNRFSLLVGVSMVLLVVEPRPLGPGIFKLVSLMLRAFQFPCNVFLAPNAFCNLSRSL